MSSFPLVVAVAVAVEKEDECADEEIISFCKKCVGNGKLLSFLFLYLIVVTEVDERFLRWMLHVVVEVVVVLFVVLQGQRVLFLISGGRKLQ
mmetsp:Transcript_23811/g.33416  ORF Transcript_23811/g.33416 Transcript_23811/m.33416 type:complete len:92 (+) Transcript_23811:383-658(+)